MNPLSWLTGAQCPKCSARLNIVKVKNRDACPKCNAELESNAVRAWVITLVVCVAALPLTMWAAEAAAAVIFGSGTGYLDKRFVLFVFHAVLIVVLYPAILRIRLASAADTTGRAVTPS
jgi:hypothetical protein